LVTARAGVRDDRERRKARNSTLGLLTKIFGNPEGGANASGEPSAAEQSSGATASTEDPVISAYPKGDSSNSGIRPAVETPPQRSREPTRPPSGNRRPEHPRMYLRPSPTTLDPAVPGSTRRQQISVRPGARDTHRAAPPPPAKRSRAEAQRPLERERPSEPSAAPGTLPPASRPKNAMVVSPVSLTPEEVQLPPGTRPKMPTLVGLGAALETPPLPLVAPTSGSRSASYRHSASNAIPSNAIPSNGVTSNGASAGGAASHGVSAGAAPNHAGASKASAGAAASIRGGVPNQGAAQLFATHPSVARAVPNGSGAVSEASEGDMPLSLSSDRMLPRGRAPFDALSKPIEVEVPADIVAPAQLLADFALKLSLGPVSRAWVPEVRRSAEALLVTGKHRHETALAALSARLLSLLPSLPTTDTAPSLDAGPSLDAAPSLDVTPTLSEGPAPQTIDGEQREQILHEVSRLAGVLPEWPAPAQDLAEEARRRETRIMRELLTVVDGFKRDQRARLEEHMRIEELAAMTPSAIAEEFEAPLERASQLSLVLDSYCQERQTRAPDVANALALGRALSELARKSRAFDDCDPEQKDAQRVLRIERRKALSSVNLLLAERGELEWLDQLEPLSIGERIERLSSWFESAGLESVGLTSMLVSDSERTG
jgi:hypothetical protein